FSPLFYSYGSRHHRDLHSFPTRRSSDLTQLVVPGVQVPLVVSSSFFSGMTLALSPPHPLSAVKSVVKANGNNILFFIFLYSNSPDRKSTRLNSSHVKISYAVFCLKKKNK